MSLRPTSLLILAFAIGPILGCSSTRNPTTFDDLWSGQGSPSAPHPIAVSASPGPGALGAGLTYTWLEGASILAPSDSEFRVAQESGLETNDAVAEATEDGMPWRFNFSMFGWIPQAPATVKLDHGAATLPESLGTILDSLQGAFEADFEARKGPFGLYVTPLFLFLRYTEHVQGPLQKHRVAIREDAIIMDFGVSYEIGRWRLKAFETESQSPQLGDIAELTVEPFVGARWVDDEIKIDLDPGPSLNTDIKFLAPVLGLRTNWQFNEHWNARIEGDYGGFNVDHLKNTYNFTGLLGYRWKAWKGAYWNAFAGYRYLDIHYDNSNKGELEVAIKGPLVGIGIQF
jgi:hypothetical protein